MQLHDLVGHHVGIWGLGREGMASAEKLMALDPSTQLTVASDTPLAKEQKLLLQQISPTATFCSGSDSLAGLSRCDVVIRSPGISLYRSELEELRQRGVQLTTATNLWFAANQGHSVIGVTGSKGKSTTSSLIAHLLSSAGRKVQLAGNIGVPLLKVEPEPDEIVVAEISSYQAADIGYTPDICVFLNLFREHTDWHLTSENYFRDKLNLASHRQDAIVVANSHDRELQARLGSDPRARWFGDSTAIHPAGSMLMDGDAAVFDCTGAALRGAHNQLNMAAALTAVKASGVAPQAVASALATFQPLPHRLQLVLEYRGLRFIDDSISTIPEATMAAFNSIEKGPIVLLVGGYDRGQSYLELARHVSHSSRLLHVICLPDTGLRMLSAMETVAGEDQTQGRDVRASFAPSLASAVTEAIAMARDDCTILLSPGAPSYGQFANFEERGNQFADLARKATQG